jgi:hypothetical protein
MIEILEDRSVPTTINLTDLTGLPAGYAWVAGFNGGGSSGLEPVSPGQGAFTATTQAFYPIGSGTNQINSIDLSSGSGRLIFVVSATQPPAMNVGQGAFTAAPFPVAPSPLPVGPQDFFEFAYNGNDDLTAVNGFGLNLSFTDPTINETYGVNPVFSREAVGAAYSAFMTRDPQGQHFSKLLYPSSSYPLPPGITVPGNQFFAICDPNDWLVNYPGDDLASYWDSTLNKFFQAGNYLSINLNAAGPTNTYSGMSVAAGATQSGSTVTITTTDLLTNLNVGDTVSIAGVAASGYNGTFTVTGKPTANSFTYTNPTSGLPNSGSGTVTDSSMVYNIGFGGPGASQSGTTVTITTMQPLIGMQVGDSVTITGSNVADYNGTFTVTAMPTTHSFTFTHTKTGLPNANFGIVTDTTQSPPLQFGIVPVNYYVLSNGTDTGIFPHPGTGLTGAQYVFGNVFGPLTPSGSAGDMGLLQDQIWQALNRGVALDGVSLTPITNAQTTGKWNDPSTWYTQHASAAFPTFKAAYNTYGKFLHYSTIHGTDSRSDGGTPIYFGNAAYAFSEDETPLGPYNGGQVPSKTIANVGPSDTLTITLGPWAATGPVVTGVHADAGPTAGGTQVIITGCGFAGVTGVSFGSTPATRFTLRADGTLSATAPPHAAGTVHVTVTTPAGTSATSSADQFTYQTRYFAVGSGPGVRATVKVYAAPRTLKRTIFPFGPFKGGARVASGDVNGDAIEDIVVAQGQGGTTLVKVYHGATLAPIRQFKAFPQKAAQRRHIGVFVASADVNNDGFDDIIVAADTGWKPFVRVFSGQNGALLKQFLAFPAAFAGGVRVAAGDLDGTDGYSEIVTAKGRGSFVRVFDGQTYAPILGFNPYKGAESNKLGVFVAIGNVDGDSDLDIITGTGPKIAAEARVFDAKTGEYIDQIFRDRRLMGGIPVGVFDANGDGIDEVLVGRGPGQKSIVDIWQFKTATQRWLLVDGFHAFPNDRGTFVG